ncbi:hypothetical protein D2L64_23090 [Micromonospora radicis]|uniref:Uncharacterized protein n=1 Tax=Micromonospora radicis TaxID=1894971 RepID=A0A418MPI4_9ACTN|nr:hypothetical protein D2L64_23090 [Micromonospora radicis]
MSNVLRRWRNAALWAQRRSTPSTANPDTHRSAPSTANPDTRRSAPSTANPDTRRSTPSTANPDTRRSTPSTANPDTGRSTHAERPGTDRPTPESRPHASPLAPTLAANQLPSWAAWPTVAEPRPGRAGWLTPAQHWRANGGRW